MKKRILSLLGLTMVLVLGFACTGCSNEKEDTENKVEEEESIDIETFSDFAEFESIDWAKIGKYKVNKVNDENTKNGVYSLLYSSDETANDILNYFEGMLGDTENYSRVDVPNMGGSIKGTIHGHGITLTVINEDEAFTLVTFYSYDESYIAN